MILALDGFNLLYKMPDLEDHMHAGRLEAAMRGLVDVMHQYRQKSRKPPVVHIFFDGKKRQGDDADYESISGMHVYYSRDLSADFLIQQFVKSSSSPGEVWIVSSDKAVMDFGRRRRCHIQSSEDFAKIVKTTLRESAVGDGPEKAGEQELSKKEIAFWADMFRKRKK